MSTADRGMDGAHPVGRTRPELSMDMAIYGHHGPCDRGQWDDSMQPLPLMVCNERSAQVPATLSDSQQSHEPRKRFKCNDGMYLQPHHDVCLQVDEVTAPLNPRLLWPRFEPEPPVLEDTVDVVDEIPPTQKFQVQLSAEDSRGDHRVYPENLDRHVWPKGGLNGGAEPWMQTSLGDTLSVLMTTVTGWWLCIQGQLCRSMVKFRDVL